MISPRPSSNGERATPLSAVLLGGRLSPSPLRQALDVHVLCLPVGRRGSLLDAWVGALAAIDALSEIVVVVNTAEDVHAVSASIERATERGPQSPESQRLGTPADWPAVRVIPEPASWRGAGGLLRDVVADVPNDHAVLVCEGKRLPPPSLQPVMEAFSQREGHFAGVVGVAGIDEPAGVYLFRSDAIKQIPTIGYHDMKEQFLPSLRRNGLRVATAGLCDQVWKLRDLPTYLATVEASLHAGNGSGELRRVSDRASVSGSAILDGFCVIEPDAVIEDGAVVHDSVVLGGATVGGGAVVSRSVVGPLAAIEPRARVVRQAVSQPAAAVATGRGTGRMGDRMASELEERTLW